MLSRLVFRYLQAKSSFFLVERVEGVFKKLQMFSRLKIEAAPQLNYSANNKWLFASATGLLLLSPFFGPNRIVLPKIHTCSEPVINARARRELFLFRDKPFTELALTSVIPENVCVVHPAATFLPPYCGVSCPVAV